MGYLVVTTGRVLLPPDREAGALDALKAAMADRDGWFDPDHDAWPVASLDDLAAFVASISLRRHGDWLVLRTDEEGDPKWSEQATAFFAELARWVDQGEVAFTGVQDEDETWTYTYAAGLLTQTGVNGWDGSAEPFGEPVQEPPATQPAPTPKRWFRRR